MVLAIDAGTTGVRAYRRRRRRARRSRSKYREFPQHFPDPAGSSTTPTRSGPRSQATLAERGAPSSTEPVAAIGITDQRETTVVWDRRTGAAAAPRHRLAGPAHRRPLRRARATPATCRSCARRTGLVLDPYFSATKLEWLLGEGGVERRRRPRVRHRRLVADLEPHRRRRARHRRLQRLAAPCSTTSATRAWSRRAAATCSACRRRCCPRCARRAVGSASPPSGLPCRPGIPVSGVAGDQQAALFGQACFAPGHGQEHLRHRLVRADERRARRAPSRSTACSPPSPGRSTGPTASSPHYALEGAIFVTGAAVQWLRDGLGIIADAAEIGPLAASCADTGGVMFVPAFTGLGSPWWDPTPAARSSASPGAPAGPTWPAPSSRRWRSRPATWSRPWTPRPARRRRAAGRRRRVGRWTCCSSSRPTSSQVAGHPAHRAGDDRAGRRLPRRAGRGRVVVARRDRVSTGHVDRRVLAGASTPRRGRRRRTPSGAAPSSDRAHWVDRREYLTTRSSAPTVRSMKRRLTQRGRERTPPAAWTSPPAASPRTGTTPRRWPRSSRASASARASSTGTSRPRRSSSSRSCATPSTTCARPSSRPSRTSTIACTMIELGIRASMRWSAEHRDLLNLFQFAATEERFAPALRKGGEVAAGDVIRIVKEGIAAGEHPRQRPGDARPRRPRRDRLHGPRLHPRAGRGPRRVADEAVAFCLEGLLAQLRRTSNRRSLLELGEGPA